MKVYVSSTLRDLVDHRAAVDLALRRMGHDVIGMERYVAEASRPVERCRADVRAADLYLLILAWRYGYRPHDPDANPERRSITHLEFEAATEEPAKPVLAFLLDPDAPWPPSRMDAFGVGDDPDTMPGAAIEDFRGRIGADYLAGIFVTPEDLASQVVAAVSAQTRGIQLVERRLVEASVTADNMGAFLHGAELDDSTLHQIQQRVVTAGSTRAMILDLGGGQAWWSTRLFVLASLLRAVTDVKRLVFRDGDGRFAGMSTPEAVVDGLAAAQEVLAEYRRVLDAEPASQDVDREMARQIDRWHTIVNEPRWHAAEGERSLKVGVRVPLLRSWLHERWIDRCIRIDESGLTMTQVQQIVDSLLPDVPVERRMETTPVTYNLHVVDRDAFALELARDWVRSGLPRAPIL